MNLTKLGISGAPNATSTLTLDAWGFLVVTFDSHSATNNVKYYINGSLDSSVTYNVDFTAGAKTRSIGCQYLGAVRYFEGKMSLIRIYNRLLSALEIQNHFNREKHLFGRW